MRGRLNRPAARRYCASRWSSRASKLESLMNGSEVKGSPVAPGCSISLQAQADRGRSGLSRPDQGVNPDGLSRWTRSLDRDVSREQTTSASLIGHGGQAPFSAAFLSRLMRVTLLSVVGVVVEPALPQALVGAGRGALLSDALEGAADVNGLAPGPSSARTNCNESWFVTDDPCVRRAPPARCSTWCRRSTSCAAQPRACGPPRRSRACGPSTGTAARRICAAATIVLDRS